MKRQSVLKKEYKSMLVCSDGSEVDAFFQCFDDSMVDLDNPCRLLLSFQDKKFVSAAGDFFAALDKMRLQLEPLGITPVVNGAEKTCYPSGMSRDMGMGLSVYRLCLGVKATMKDLVKTFDNDAVKELASVTEQQAFHQLWRKSLGND